MSTASTIQVLGGIGTIGGTQVIVQEDGYRVMFDFGVTYAPGGDYWGHKIHARSGTARLRDLVTMGYVPALDGIFRPADAASLGLKPGTADSKTQIFISHLHLDHMAVIDLIADDVPIWMHRESLTLLQAVAETGEWPAVPLGARGFEWGQAIQVGPIKVTPVPVDHDIPGASALLIETSAGTVVYTGDLRLHGPNPELVDRFVATARAVDPKILLIEGTRMGELAVEPSPDRPERPPTRKETEVAGVVVEHLKATEGLAMITLYPRNTVRVANIAAALGETGRTLVLSPEAAYIFRAMGGNLDQVAVYKRHKDKEALAQGAAEGWLTQLFASGVKVLDAEAIRTNQSQYLLQLFYWDINELVDLQPAAGSIFIHSNGEPLGSFDPAYELLLRWLGRFGVELKRAYSTGHASPEDLFSVIRGVQPQVLMPIHSRFPELMEVESIRRVLPEVGAIYDIATGERIG